MTDNRTTELREKLDELGIEHFDYDKGGRTQTQWEAPDGKRHFTYETSDNPAKTARLIIAWHPTPEQAIAATLGYRWPTYEQRITGDGSNWCEIMRDAYDGLMANACETCTPEQMEQLADYIRAELRSEPVSMRTFDSMETALSIAEKEVEIEELRRENDELCKENEELAHRRAELEAAHGTLTAEQVRKVMHDCSKYPSWQAIADELNAKLGSGTCEPKWTLQGKTQTQEFWRCECGNCGYEFGVEDRQSFPWHVVVGSVDVPNFCPECGVKQKAVER